MLTVGIAYTKPGNNQEIVAKAFKEGLKANGDRFIDLRYFNSLRNIEQCDAVLLISYPDIVSQGYKICDEIHDHRVSHHSLINTFRIEIFKKCIELKKRMLCLDSGVTNFTKSQDIIDNTYQLGWDRIKGLGQYYNSNSPSDRWDSLKKDVKVRKEFGAYTLLFGQVRFGVGSQHIDIKRWYRQAITSLLDADPNRRIIIRMHPNDQVPAFPVKKLNIKFVPPNVSLATHLDQSSCTISFSSHSIVDSIIEGIPSYCCSKLSMGYPLHYVETANEIYTKKPPEQDKVMQWLYDLAYTQWKVSEIHKGLAWNHLRPHAKKVDDVRFDDMLCKF